MQVDCASRVSSKQLMEIFALLNNSLPEQVSYAPSPGKGGEFKLSDETERLVGVFRVIGNTMVALGD